MAFKSFSDKLSGFLASDSKPSSSPISGSLEKSSFVFGSGDYGSVDNSIEKSQKAFLPNFKKGEKRGQPKGFVDRLLPVGTLRRMYHYNPVVFSAINAIINIVVSAKWDIVQKDKEQKVTVGQKEKIKKIKDFLYVPNKNKESFRVILEKVLKDIFIIGAGSIEKGRSDADGKTLVELFAIDAGTIKMDSDEHGRILGYYQEIEGEGVPPVHFDSKDLIYLILNPRSESLYGVSILEILHQTVTAYLYAESNNIKYFENSSTPRGILDLGVHIQEHQLDRFRSFWQAENVQQPHRTMVVGGSTSGIKWVPVAMNPKDMDLMNYLNWLQRVILMAFGVSPAEVGLTEDISKAPATGQLISSDAFRNKSIYPMMDKLSWYLTQELVLSEFEADDLMFDFVKETSLQEQEQKARIHQILISSQLRTANELRKEDGLDIMPAPPAGAGMPMVGGAMPLAGAEVPPTSAGMPLEGAPTPIAGEAMPTEGVSIPPTLSSEVLSESVKMSPEIKQAFGKLKQEVLSAIGQKDVAIKEAFQLVRDEVLNVLQNKTSETDKKVDSIEDSYKKLVALVKEVLPKQVEI
jgi:HK97 family phage portal protein